jgi:hypothetical protein
MLMTNALNKRVLYSWFLTKYAAAFFNISRSSMGRDSSQSVGSPLYVGGTSKEYCKSYADGNSYILMMFCAGT